MPKKPKDPRSTQRKRARAVLVKVGRPLVCADCSKPEKTKTDPDYNGRIHALEVNHKDKNIMNNDPINLEYLCSHPCHKKKDSQTAKGVAVEEVDHGYGF